MTQNVKSIFKSESKANFDGTGVQRQEKEGHETSHYDFQLTFIIRIPWFQPRANFNLPCIWAASWQDIFLHSSKCQRHRKSRIWISTTKCANPWLMPLASSRNSHLTCNWILILKDALPSYFEQFEQLLLVRIENGFIDGGLPTFFWLHMWRNTEAQMPIVRSGICMSSHRTPLRPGKVTTGTGRVFLAIFCSSPNQEFVQVTAVAFRDFESQTPNHFNTPHSFSEFQFSFGDFCPAGSSSYPGSLGFAEPVPWGFCGRCPLDELDNRMRILKIVWW